MKNQNRPLISVIIPSYNHDIFVKQAIISVLQQTRQNLELIIVDDGSKDNSLEIIEETFRKNKMKFKNITMSLISQANRGAHHALNRGLRHASGHYLTILNSDDYYFQNRLEILEAALIRGKSEFAFSYVRHVDERNRPVGGSHPMKSWYDREISVNHFPSVGYRVLWSNLAVTTGNFFFTKKLYENVGAFRDLCVIHDYDFLLRSLFYCEPILVGKQLMAYRVHGENTIAKHSDLSVIEGPLVAYEFFKRGILEPRPRNKKAPCQAYWKEYYTQFWRTENSWLSNWIGRQDPTVFADS